MTFQEMWDKLPEDCKLNCSLGREMKFMVDQHMYWAVQEDLEVPENFFSSFWDGADYCLTEAHCSFDEALARAKKEVEAVAEIVKQTLMILK